MLERAHSSSCIPNGSTRMHEPIRELAPEEDLLFSVRTGGPRFWAVNGRGAQKFCEQFQRVGRLEPAGEFPRTVADLFPQVSAR